MANYTFSNNQFLGTWSFGGQSWPLRAATFDNGLSYWLTQDVSDSGTAVNTKFVIRGRNLLNSTSVTMASGVARSVYTDLSGGDTTNGGLDIPSAFDSAVGVPNGYTKKAFPDTTPYYERNGGAGCVFSDGLQVATFGTGDPIQAKYFNGTFWVAQVIGANPIQVVIRGKELLTSGQVTVNRPDCIDLFSDTVKSGGSGFGTPSSFTTPAGWVKKNYPDGTPYYELAPTGQSVQVPTIKPVGLTTDANGFYIITANAQLVTINATNTSNTLQWRLIQPGGSDIPLVGETAATLSMGVYDGFIIYLLLLDSNRNTLAQSNYIQFKTGTPQSAIQSPTPTFNASSVTAGTPIVITTCSSGVVEVTKNGSSTATVLPKAIDGTGGTRYEYIPLSPSVGDFFTFYQTCPGKTKSTGGVVNIMAYPVNGCDTIVDGSVLGIWNSAGGAVVLKARKFNNLLWVTQVLPNDQKDVFVPRGANILQRTDVSTNFSNCTSSFSGGNTGSGGTAGLPAPATFPATIAGYDRATFADQTPYYQTSSTTPTVAIPQIVSPLSTSVSIMVSGTSGQPGTVQVYKDGVFHLDITNVENLWSFTPAIAGGYTFRLKLANGSLSAFSATVVVANSQPTTGPCAINDKQQVGTFQNYPLVARKFNGLLWLTQQISQSPDVFVVRGRNFIEYGGINTSFAQCKTSFAGADTGSGGTAGFPMPPTFETPEGFTRGEYGDKTPFFTANGSGGGTIGTTDDSAVPTAGQATASFDVVFADTCGNPVHYAASKVISDYHDTRLVWQDSNRFTVSSGTFWFFAKEKATQGVNAVGQVSQQVITV